MSKPSAVTTCFKFNVLSAVWLLLFLASTALATPTPTREGHGAYTYSQLSNFQRDVVQTNSAGATGVYNPTTSQQVPQGVASDGSGSGFSIPAILWVAFSFTTGAPLMLAGIRGWRFTTGTALGLTIAVCSWAAFTNTMSGGGISDLVLTILVLVLFGFGFALGLLEAGRIAGLLLLGILGGLALGIRIILLRPGLLITGTRLYVLNWLLIALVGLLGISLILLRQRAGITLGSASIGTFLCCLGLDLIINKQSGLSCGLRYLFDRNPSHLVYILNNGYEPPKTTPILLAISLALTPAFAYMQHRLFPHTFSRKSPRDDEISVGTVVSPEETKPLSPESSSIESSSSAVDSEKPTDSPSTPSTPSSPPPPS
ncbi:hypothetical protein SERLA73DRAFT_178693 [Serpula lacrymans var. lacrymans S7.3]|uniref:TM7S3/TM198-like domain-containing protein n=2 Tax=Serpula lacrymans var. lacrymans TaxID=341189 RepID=F8PSK8_SERL3|nr:uncharacterized protein SERLADRAFT_463272 [Serpula lacrymans var. lacrymans S7.9]EGO00767.1 hypothetical protein SERLA73DRAFT_178693 [Serpula lacrymans var. lacrymans S7.3]EGO26329.1 hypothetical protein SERLADRAFT_463272 [Serpula lacrymans var. lacrymans S7.9]